MTDGEIEIGVVTRPQGVNGEFRVHLHNAATDLLDRVKTLTAVSPDGHVREAWVLRSFRPAGRGQVVVSVAGTSDRNAAEARRGFKLFVPSAFLPALQDDEFYHYEVVGWPVVTGSGRPVGTVRRVADTGVDVLDVELIDGRELLIPVVADFVLAVDRSGCRVVVVEDLERLFEEVL